MSELPSLADRALVLATDLDGTFLGGSKVERERLYRWIEERRSTVGLIFVTGRDPGFITELTRGGGVPKPDYVVGDVGTTIATVGANHEIRPIEALEAEIAAAWSDAGEKARAALAGAPGLTPQPTAFRYRVSFDMDPSAFDPAALKAVHDLGLDALVSDNRFLDVLPKGVSKGPSLSRLLAYLDVDERRCLAAGDTLNDFSMLALGLPAVAVGGSEPALKARLAGRSHVHFATAKGAAGIEEAIAAFGFLSDAAH